MNSATATVEEAVEEKIGGSKSWDEYVERDAPLSGRLATLAPSEGRFAHRFAVSEGSAVRLRRLYEFRGGLDVDHFLRNNPYLSMLLLEAHEEIRKYFPTGTRVALEIVADPEAQEDQQLFVVIRTRLSPRVAHTLLSVLDQNWWLDVLPRAKGKMEVSLERITGTS